jgi:hypothetical protein
MLSTRKANNLSIVMASPYQGMGLLTRERQPVSFIRKIAKTAITDRQQLLNRLATFRRGLR